MTQKDEVKTEYKTIRVSAGNYYKLVELAGMLSALGGYNFSLTQLADGMIALCHQSWYPEMMNIMNNPQKLKEFRPLVQANLNQWYTAFKDVKIRK